MTDTPQCPKCHSPIYVRYEEGEHLRVVGKVLEADQKLHPGEYSSPIVRPIKAIPYCSKGCF